MQLNNRYSGGLFASRAKNWTDNLATFAVMLLIGALGALLLSQLFLIRYKATVSLAMHGDVQLYRRAEEPFRALEWFRRFGRGLGLEVDANYRTIEEQLAGGYTRPLSIEHSFRLSRNDIRELPDVVAKEVVPQMVGQLKTERNDQPLQIKSDLVVSATHANADTALRLAEIGIKFARDTLLRISLMDALKSWKIDAANELAGIRSHEIAQRVLIESLSRRIHEMDAVRVKYKDFVGSGKIDSGVQVQVSGARYLSPTQQIVGLEAERVEAIEQLKLSEQSALRLLRLTEFGSKMDELFRSDPNTIKTFELMLAQHAAQHLSSSTSDGSLVDLAAHADINRAMTALRGRFLDTTHISTEPTFRREGPSAMLAIAVGLVAGLVGWWWLVLSYRRTAARNSG